MQLIKRILKALFVYNPASGNFSDDASGITAVFSCLLSAFFWWSFIDTGWLLIASPLELPIWQWSTAGFIIEAFGLLWLATCLLITSIAAKVVQAMIYHDTH